MANTALSHYLEDVDFAIQSGSGKQVAEYFSIQHHHAFNAHIYNSENESCIKKVLEPQWAELMTHHLKCLRELNKEDYVEAFKHHYSLSQAFSKVLQSQKEENWALPIMYTLCLDLRQIAIKADLQLDKKDKPNEMLEKGADLLMGFFRICVADNRSVQEETKRWGILNLTNQLFKIYFKVNKLHLLKPLIRVIESSSLKDHYPIAQRVTYKYFVGQQQMFQNNFKLAEENLSFAFMRCHRDSKKNKRLILIFLITVKMVLGSMPTMNLLRKYDLLQFAEVAKAVKEGNLERFSKAIDDSEEFFNKWGVRLVLEKLRTLVIRNLFKKMYLILNTYIIHLDAFKDALNFKREIDQEVPIGSEEVLCNICNLIYENLIKGYISYKFKKVVLSKQNAFPPLQSID